MPEATGKTARGMRLSNVFKDLVELCMSHVLADEN